MTTQAPASQLPPHRRLEAAYRDARADEKTMHAEAQVVSDWIAA